MHAPAWANADSTRLGGISQRSASSDLFSLLYYLIVRLRSRSRSSPSFPLQYFRSIFRVCTIALLISGHKCLQGGCAQAIQTKTNTNTAYSCTPPILWDLGDISQSPSRNGWAHGRLLRCRSKLDPHQANFDMFLGSGILDLSPLGFKGFQLGSLSLGITSISSIAAQSSLWLRLSVRIIIFTLVQMQWPSFDRFLGSGILDICRLFMYKRPGMKQTASLVNNLSHSAEPSPDICLGDGPINCILHCRSRSHMLLRRRSDFNCKILLWWRWRWSWNRWKFNARK